MLGGSFDVQRPSRAQSCCLPGGSIFSRRPLAAFGVRPNDVIHADYWQNSIPEAKSFLAAASIDGMSHVDIVCCKLL